MISIVTDATGLIIMLCNGGTPDPPAGCTVTSLTPVQVQALDTIGGVPNGGVKFDGVNFTSLPFVPPVVLDPADSGNLPKAMKALLLVMATWSGKTPVQAKAAFLAAWNALP